MVGGLRIVSTNAAEVSMSESYSESTAVPEQTLSAMAESSVLIFDSDEYVADQEAPPAEISPDRLETDRALADITSRIRALPPFKGSRS